jgi:hypothetical protein
MPRTEEQAALSDDQAYGIEALMPAGTTAREQKVIAAMVRRIDPDLTAHRMIAAFEKEIPAYARMPGDSGPTSGVEMVRQNVETFVRCASENRAPQSGEIEVFRRSSERRFEEGIRLEEILSAYRLGGRVLWNELAGNAETDEERAVLPRIGDLVMTYVDAISSAVTEHYLARQQQPVAEDERHLRDLLEGLASNLPLTAHGADLADRMRFPIVDRYRPFAAFAPGGSARDLAALAPRLRKLGLLAVTEGNRIVGLLAPGQPEPGQTGRIAFAVGDSTPRGELAQALDELRSLIDLQRTFGNGRAPRRDDFLPELLLVSSPRLAAALRDRVLGGLEEYTDRRSTSDLLETLNTYVSCELDRRVTAAKLHIHRNTLDYRLRRIEELAEVDLSHPRDLLLVWLALRQRQLDEDRIPYAGR